jgi:hypothetical protein
MAYMCFKCGYKYLTDRQKEEDSKIVTANLGRCVECKEDTIVVHERHYNYGKKPKEN